MLLLAEISWVGMGLLTLFGLAMFKCTRGACGRGPGFMAKTLGVVAVVAGVWMLVGRDASEHKVVIDHEVAREFRTVDVRFQEDGPLGDNFNPLGDNFDPLGEDFDPLRGHDELFRDSSPHIGMFVLLGAGLIILGVMLFGRNKQKPFALKAITWLGIGAIIFAVANFFGEAPHADRVSHRVVDARARQVEEEHAARRPSRPGRAKRPALRPTRPSNSSSDRDEAEITLPTAGRLDSRSRSKSPRRRSSGRKLSKKQNEPARKRPEKLRRLRPRRRVR